MNNKLSKIPINWKWVTLDDIGIVVSGGTPSTKEPEFWNGDIPWVTPADLSNYNEVYLSKGRRNISKVGLEYSSATLLPENSIIFSSRAPIGYVAITKNELATNQGFKNLIIFKDHINPKFIYYYLSSIKELANEMASGTTFLELSGTKFKQLPFPLAPIEEQNRIVDKIEELFSNIDESTRQINSALEKAKSYIKKTIYEQFKGNLLQDNVFNELPSTWKWKKLFEIGSVYSGGTPSTKKNEYWGGDISWITPADLSNYNEVYISDGKRFISQLGLDKSSAKLLPEGTILFSTRAPIGYVVIAKNEIATNQGFKNIVINEGINKLYVYYYLKSITDYAKKIASGTTFLELSTNKFREIPIPIAPINEQINIVNTIENAIIYSNRLSDELNNEKKKIESIKRKILKDAFQGKLSQQYKSDSSTELLLIEISKIKEEYIKNQIEIKKNKPKFIKMAKEKLSIIEVLKKHKEPISAENLWQKSEYEKIDDFYEKLKDVEHLIIQDISQKTVKISLK